MKLFGLGLEEAARWAEKLKPLLDYAYSGLLRKGRETAPVSTPGSVMSVSVVAIDNEEDVENLAKALRDGVRGEDKRWHGHTLRFATVVMHIT